MSIFIQFYFNPLKSQNETRMSAPALETGGGRAVAYDVGGTELYVVDEGGEVGSLTQQRRTRSFRPAE